MPYNSFQSVVAFYIGCITRYMILGMSVQHKPICADGVVSLLASTAVALTRSCIMRRGSSNATEACCLDETCIKSIDQSVTTTYKKHLDGMPGPEGSGALGENGLSTPATS
jgi:hypothetical protein